MVTTYCSRIIGALTLKVHVSFYEDGGGPRPSLGRDPREAPSPALRPVSDQSSQKIKTRKATASRQGGPGSHRCPGFLAEGGLGPQGMLPCQQPQAGVAPSS